MHINFYGVGLFEKKQIKRVLEFARDTLKQPQELELAVAIVGVNEICQLNNSTRGIDKPTDVLSFPIIDAKRECLNLADNSADINLETGNLMLGDIVICKQVAKVQAKEFGHSYKREICFLALHGFLHLLGFDHETETDSEEMFSLQRKILEELGINR